jgi:diguanylate cyclase (GGDEF)-like protein/PAS domain S-box-containing protein
MEGALRVLLIGNDQTVSNFNLSEALYTDYELTHKVVETEDSYRLAIRSFKPDLIISEFSLPHLQGMQILEIAKELVPDVPVIFVAPTVDAELAIQALRNGASDFVTKADRVRLPEAIVRAVQSERIHRERRDSEAWLRLQSAALDAAVNAIMITDRDGTIRWVNRAFSRLTGYSPEEAIGKNPRMLQSGQHGPEFYRQLFESVLSGSVWQGEIVNRYKNGRLGMEEMTITPVRGSDSAITHFIAIKQDITARKEAEKRREQLVAILEASPDFVATAGPDGGVLYLNSAARRLLEVPNEVEPSQIRIMESHPPWAADLVLEIGIPAAIRDGVWSGETALLSRSGREIPVSQVIIAHKRTDGSVEFLSTIARDISERKIHELRINRLNRMLSVLSGVNTAIVRIRDRGELLREVCRVATEEGRFRMAWIGLIDADARDVEPAAWAGCSEDIARSVNWAVIESSAGMMYEAFRTRKIAICNDIKAQPAGGPLRRAAREAGHQSVACLPVVVDDRVAALITLYAAEKDYFDTEELALLAELSGDVSFALDYMAKGERLDYLALYDALTGLPNSRLFVDRVGQQMRTRVGESLVTALILLNVERFRFVNDTFGRHGGDHLLRQIAERLERAFHGKDYLARVGGNIFGAVVRGVRGTEGVLRIVEDQIMACFSEPYDIGGQSLRVSARAGIALFPGDGTDAESLYRNAEAALERARKSGERRLFYAPEMNARAAAQLRIEGALRQAVLEEQFVLHYQPRIELKSGKICGLEALIRWAHPERGLVPPGEFIPILEDTGLILEVGRWALRRAAQEHAAWRAAGLSPPRLAVNVSVIQLRQRSFVEDVQTALPETSGFREHMDIEITESMLMEDFEGNIAKLTAVRAMGLQIAMDDFGVGYSSLSYLAKLPIDALKIDRSFITLMPKSPEQMAIISAIISLGHALNLKVVAEGVETEEQANLLRLIGCDEAQGYLFSKPVPQEVISALLRK